MTINVTGQKTNINELFNEEFVEIMSDLEDTSLNGGTTTLNQAESFMVIESVNMIMEILAQNNLLFNHLQQNGHIHFSGPSKQ